MNDLRTVYYGQPPIQTEFPRWYGNPENVYYAPCGYVVMDYDTGDMYRKTTPQEFNTGWVVTLGGGSAGGGGTDLGMSKGYETFVMLRAETRLVDEGFYWLRGGYALHDGNGGTFTYNADSLAPDDDYNTIMPDSKDILTAGRWERDF
jgi:hypothetical protein